MQYEITMDLCRDYSELVQSWMRQQEIQSDKIGEDLWYEFFNLQKKKIKPQKRKVWFSNEFSCQADFQNGLKILVHKFEIGDDVSLNLSKDAHCASEFDALLYDWGIYHFHLGETIDRKTGRITRTGPILFAKVDDRNVYCIDVYFHGKGVASPWSKQEMVKILHNNWPETIKKYRLPEGIQLYPTSVELPTDQEYSLLRNSGITTPIFVDKGIAYFSPGGGYMSTGHSYEVVSICQKIHNTLKLNEIYIKENITSLVKNIERVAGELPECQLHLKLLVQNGEFCVVDLHSMVKLVPIKF